MFDCIPIQFYTITYFHLMFLLALIFFVFSKLYEITDNNTLSFLKKSGYFILFFSILYMGLRPISGHYFGDMGDYNGLFLKIKSGNMLIFNDDWFFSLVTKSVSPFLNSKGYFLFLSILYIIPLFIFSKKYFKDFWMLSFFMLIVSFSFWPYGVNGMRNGLATSFFILALCFYDKKILMYLIMILGAGFHKSLVLPIVAFIFAQILTKYKISKYLPYLWILSIPMSFFSSGFWENLFSGLMEDERLSTYLTNSSAIDMNMFSSTGFRWDFIIYSSIPVIFGYYYLNKFNIKDILYKLIYSTYLICNIFWILVNKAPYSNRFAYLSWFLMAIVIVFPFAKYKLWDNHFKSLSYVVLGYFAFTYFMVLIGK